MSDDKVFGRADEFLAIFKKGAEFTRELIEENERLRHELAGFDEAQRRAAADPTDWSKLRHELLDQIDALRAEKDNVLERLRHVEDENRQFAQRYVEIEEENNNLANLYVASYQLHSTLSLNEVFKIILEIVINLVGAEVFAVYVLDEKTRRLEPVASEGRDLPAFPCFGLGQGQVGEAVASGEAFCGDPTASEDWKAPIACIPLRVQDRPIGAIAIYALLEQKESFTPLDHELFTLLAGHAATAIFAAQLYSQSERKLNTIQGFIDLLRK